MSPWRSKLFIGKKVIKQEGHSIKILFSIEFIYFETLVFVTVKPPHFDETVRMQKTVAVLWNTGTKWIN